MTDFHGSNCVNDPIYIDSFLPWNPCLRHLYETVGRKSANVIISESGGKAEGVVVDWSQPEDEQRSYLVVKEALLIC